MKNITKNNVAITAIIGIAVTLSAAPDISAITLGDKCSIPSKETVLSDVNEQLNELGVDVEAEMEGIQSELGLELSRGDIVYCDNRDWIEDPGDWAGIFSDGVRVISRKGMFAAAYLVAQKARSKVARSLNDAKADLKRWESLSTFSPTLRERKDARTNAEIFRGRVIAVEEALKRARTRELVLLGILLSNHLEITPNSCSGEQLVFNLEEGRDYRNYNGLPCRMGQFQ